MSLTKLPSSVTRMSTMVVSKRHLQINILNLVLFLIIEEFFVLKGLCFLRSEANRGAHMYISVSLPLHSFDTCLKFGVVSWDVTRKHVASMKCLCFSFIYFMGLIYIFCFVFCMFLPFNAMSCHVS